MRRHGFVNREIDPGEVFSRIKNLVESEGFRVVSEDVREGLWDLHARRSSVEKVVLGRVRDLDVVVAGRKGKFEVQLNAGIWGRDLAVPAIEGVATLGLATAAELHSARKFEEKLWEEVVHLIDPALRVCPLDGLLFKTDKELKEHEQAHEAQRLAGEANALNVAAIMAMGGLVGVGMGPLVAGEPFWV
jgi:hypothetical protein